MDVQIAPVEWDQKPVLRQLLELYNYDFSEYDDEDIGECGWYGYKYLDHYWTEGGRTPFFIRVDGKLSGLVLVNEHCYIAQEPGTKSIAEFFVMRKYRRRGIGRAVAVQVFDRFPGKWEVLQHGGNRPSYVFWEKVIGAYTDGRYEKGRVVTEDWEGQAITFDNSK
jgi:predicted acetyltransferase